MNSNTPRKTSTLGYTSVISRCVLTGFTLAELLIALAILGVIATFTIPKILNSQQNGKYNAAAKEAASIVSAAYQQAQMNNQVTPSTIGGNLTQYINYVSTTTASIDSMPNDTGSKPCASPYVCIELHNGGTILFDTGSFGGTATTNAIWFMFDPDGTLTSNSTTTGAGQSVAFFLYYSGRISEMGSITANTSNANGSLSANPASTPSWFSW